MLWTEQIVWKCTKTVPFNINSRLNCPISPLLLVSPWAMNDQCNLHTSFRRSPFISHISEQWGRYTANIKCTPNNNAFCVPRKKVRIFPVSPHLPAACHQLTQKFHTCWCRHLCRTSPPMLIMTSPTSWTPLTSSRSHVLQLYLLLTLIKLANI